MFFFFLILVLKIGMWVCLVEFSVMGCYFDYDVEEYCM